MTLTIGSSQSVSLSAFNKATGIVNDALERLSTGKRVNDAADAPGDVVSIDALKARISRLNGRIDGLTQNNLRLGAREAQLGTVNDLAIELEGLIVRAANGSVQSDEERDGLRLEIASTIEAMRSLGQNGMFRGEQVIYDDVAALGLDRFLGGGEFDLFAPSADGAEAGADDGSGDDSGALDLGKVAELAQDAAGEMVEQLGTTRATLGAQMNENEALIEVSTEELIQTTDALSRIEDADLAREASELTRGQLLQEAALTTERIAREQAEAALELLKSAVQGVG